MKLDVRQINQLLDEMESTLKRIQKISNDFSKALELKKEQQYVKKAA